MKNLTSNHLVWRYIQQGWYGNNISIANTESWINNFDPKEKNTAYFLLSSLIFYQKKQLESMVNFFERRIMSRFCISFCEKKGKRVSDHELLKEWANYRENICILPATFKNDVGGSAYYAANLWRNNTKFPVESIDNFREIINSAKYKEIIFVDDFIGTGSRMSSFLKKEHSDGQLTFRICEIIDEHPEMEFRIFVFCSHEKGVNTIKSELPQVEVEQIDFFTDKYDLLNTNCILYQGYENEKDQIINCIRAKVDRIDPRNQYCLNLPIAFEYGCPNNSLELYWCNSNWNPLMKLGHPCRKPNEERR